MNKNYYISFIAFIFCVGKLHGQGLGGEDYSDKLEKIQNQYCIDLFNSLEKADQAELHQIKHDSTPQNSPPSFLSDPANILSEVTLNKQQAGEVLSILKENTLQGEKIIGYEIYFPAYVLEYWKDNTLMFSFHLFNSGGFYSIRYPDDSEHYFESPKKLKDMISRLSPPNKNEQLRFQAKIKKLKSLAPKAFYAQRDELYEITDNTDKKLQQLRQEQTFTRFVFYQMMEDPTWRKKWINETTPHKEVPNK